MPHAPSFRQPAHSHTVLAVSVPDHRVDSLGIQSARFCPVECLAIPWRCSLLPSLMAAITLDSLHAIDLRNFDEWPGNLKSSEFGFGSNEHPEVQMLNSSCLSLLEKQMWLCKISLKNLLETASLLEIPGISCSYLGHRI